MSHHWFSLAPIIYINKKIENKVKKLVKQIHKDRMITDDLKSYLMPSGGTSGDCKVTQKFTKGLYRSEPL